MKHSQQEVPLPLDQSESHHKTLCSHYETQQHCCSSIEMSCHSVTNDTAIRNSNNKNSRKKVSIPLNLLQKSLCSLFVSCDDAICMKGKCCWHIHNYIDIISKCCCHQSVHISKISSPPNL